MSAPATNAFSPAPVRIAARTLESCSMFEVHCSRSVIVCRFRALYLSGRLTVTTATDSSTSYRRFWYSMVPPGYHWWGPTSGRTKEVGADLIALQNGPRGASVGGCQEVLDQAFQTIGVIQGFYGGGDFQPRESLIEQNQRGLHRQPILESQRDSVPGQALRHLGAVMRLRLIVRHSRSGVRIG